MLSLKTEKSAKNRKGKKIQYSPIADFKKVTVILKITHYLAEKNGFPNNIKHFSNAFYFW